MLCKSWFAFFHDNDKSTNLVTMNINNVTFLEFLCSQPSDSGFNPNPLGNHPTNLTANPTDIRWYYNPTNGQCEMFPYLYGGGNFNNFGSPCDCEKVCKNQSTVIDN